MSDVLMESTNTEVAEIATTTIIPGLDVTPPDANLNRAEDRMSTRIAKELVLRDAITITRTHYDVILLDCPPNLGTLTINALVAADKVLLPCNPTALAVAGVGGLLSAVEEVQQRLNPDLDVLGMVFTRVDGRTTKTNTIVRDMVEEAYGDLVLSTEIGINNDLAAAQLEGQDVYDYAPQSRGALQYRALADAVLKRIS